MNNYNKLSNQLIIVISSPSGAGKTSICKELLLRDEKIKLSISDTTRKPRDNEIDGIDYNFLTHDEFKKKLIKNKFLEHAKVFQNYYASSLESVKELLNQGFDVLFDIDWQGAVQISNSNLTNIVTIFVMPPSKEIIIDRLTKRSTETGDNSSSVAFRMKQYENDIGHRGEYKYQVVNDNFDNSVEEIIKIIQHERSLIN